MYSKSFQKWKIVGRGVNKNDFTNQLCLQVTWYSKEYSSLLLELPIFICKVMCNLKLLHLAKFSNKAKLRECA